MRKLVFFVFIFFIIFLSIPIQGVTQQANSEAGYQVIPDEAIRLRILANSDKDEDQRIKRIVRDEVNESITKWVKDIADINEARKVIQAQLPEIKQIVASTLGRENVDSEFQVEYGKNVSFPAKLYGSFLYPAGEYEAVLITLGKGKGANWWCVLFPPLCFLDFSNGTSVASAADKDMEIANVEKVKQDDEVEVKFFLFEWIESVIDFIFKA
ncbi:stage II sporulation protein R [Virgibacillus oceani]|uniref:Stage II sporulation protein R n=1 Tax=Virgibacillus oceani TaxID=1479511 RepID=A0A917HRD8_9BACI|nr:stage II sporulation protein R [Virgibacillus oceani]GGG87899.1 stage II sporulation protein R [Virgibacillus oceani]